MAPSPFSFLRSSFSPGSKFSALLRTYFRSGWAFFIPYLAAYLLYAWLDGPVNPGNAGNVLVERISGNGSAADSAFSLQPSAFLPPSLLHVYWFLHALHAVLGGLALASLWRGGRKERGAGSRNEKESSAEPSNPCPDLQSSICQHPSDLQPFRLSALQKSAPWLLLALIFWIPGLYLEWPSDPWEHLRRINEWHAHSIVTDHSSWKKSSYFLPYSLTGQTTGLTQLSWLNFYYSGICLLLCWQYHRLARAVGLGDRASMIFVIVQALMMGNNIFSFYRYYGLSSSIFAQIGAIALTRIALEILGASQRHTPNGKKQGAIHPRLSTLYSLSRAVPALVVLLPLIALNHVQAFGIAGLSILAVVVWRLIEWKHTMLGWLALAAIVASVVTILWFPRHPAVDDIYRPEDWLNDWYGFNLFSTGSPASSRSFHILGAFGVLNLALALWLVLHRNHVAGWLTLIPVVALALPCFALPFAHVVAAKTSTENIVIFHRMLLAMPMGIALVTVLARGRYGEQREVGGRQTSKFGSRFSVLRRPMPPLLLSPFALILFPSFVLTTLPPDSSAFNRFWHSLHVTPEDLNLRLMITEWSNVNLALAASGQPLAIDSPLGTRDQGILVSKHNWWDGRQVHRPINETKRPVTHMISQAGVPLLALWPNTSAIIDPQPWRLAKPRPSANLAAVSNLFADASPTFSLSSPDKLALTIIPANWEIRGGESPLVVGAGAEAPKQAVIENPPSGSSELFLRQPLHLRRDRSYHVEMTLRGRPGGAAPTYIAAAWFDADGNLLRANEPPPHGGGNPRGWSNGTYSYVSLSGQTPPTEWTTWRFAFGMRERSAPPPHAVIAKIGVLLNPAGLPEVATQWAGATIRILPAPELRVFTPRADTLFTARSSAGFLSAHWLPQQAAVERGGGGEINAFLEHHDADAAPRAAPAPK